jgi:arabinose-5-phosphate isomerase
MSESSSLPWPLGDIIAIGKRVLLEEAEAVASAADGLDVSFVDAVRLILNCRSGRVIASGVGKSGHVARKLSATFSSTGTPSFFLHAAEGGHGDLGAVTDKDVLIAISNSGESEEVVNITSFAKRYGAKIIVMSRSSASSLGKLCDVHLNCKVDREACPLGVAPTTSTTLQMALGDALAMATLASRGFSTEDFARTHPFGQLGRRHYMRIRDVMQPISEIPNVDPAARLLDVMPTMALGRMGAVVVIDNGGLAGIFTDSDLRRLITQYSGNLDQQLGEPISTFMTKQPFTLDQEHLASDALRVFEEKRISRIVCVNGKKVAGILAWHNLLQHKIA